MNLPLIFVYFKISILLSVLIYSGISLFRRATEERRAEVVIPSGVIIGIAIYIFLLNLVAHFLKGPLGFYLALIIELALVFVVRTFVKPPPLLYPVGLLKRIWVISLLVWSIFLYVITSTGHALSGDASTHYILASLFLRGDYPIHSPFQPDYIAYYHLGSAELLGAFKSITGANFELLFSLFSFIFLLSISQILTFILKPNPDKPYPVFLSFLVSIVAIISLGEFMIALPFMLELPNTQGNLAKWLGQLPLYGAFGASTSLDSFSLFIHRILSIAYFIGLLPLILYPKIKLYILPTILIGLTLMSTALTDESVLIVILIPILIISFFTIFNRSILKLFLFCFLTLIIVAAQGGIITESLFGQNPDKPEVLFFPKDETGPLAYYYQYRSYRLNLMKNILYQGSDSYNPFKFFHPGIIQQLSLFFVICFGYLLYKLPRTESPRFSSKVYKSSRKPYLSTPPSPRKTVIALSIHPRHKMAGFSASDYKNKDKNESLGYLLWLLLISSVSSLFFYHALVPEDLYHINGSRLLGLAYHFSGLGVAIFILYWWANTKVTLPILRLFNIIVKVAIIWILFFSIIIPLMQLFPRSNNNWFTYVSRDQPLYKWIRENIAVDKRIIMLTDEFPTSSSNTDLVTKVGVLTPVWTSEYLATGFDTNPTYSDVFYTLNPQLLKILKIDYIVIGDQYLFQLSKLSQKRTSDLKNQDFFQIMFRDPATNNVVLRVLPEYFSTGENLNGTFYELRNIAPKSGSYFMEGYPNIAFGFHRSAQLALYDREIYYDNNKAPLYGFVVNVVLKYYEGHKGPYDFLILGENTDPKNICHCNAKLLWEGLGNGIKLWKVML